MKSPRKTGMKCICLALLLLSSMMSVLTVLGPEDVQAHTLSTDAWIMGKITSDGVTPVPDSYVKVMNFMIDGPAEAVNYTWTDTSGNYSVGVPGGFQYALFVVNGSYYLPFEMVTVMPGQTAWMNITMVSIYPLGTNVTIKGYVKNETGAPMSAGHIIGMVFDPIIKSNGPPRYGNLTSPDGSGYFQMNVIAGSAGGGATAMDFAGYPGMTENRTSDPLVNGSTYWFNLTLSKTKYNDDARIYGYVRDNKTGLPIPSVTASVRITNSFTPSGGYYNHTYTNDSGYYEMNVVNGSCRIVFSKLGYSMNSSDISVPIGGNIRIDTELVRTNATVKGNVTDLKTGDPLMFARVFISDGKGNMATATTNSTGAYVLLSLVGNNLTIGAEYSGYARNMTKINLADGETKWMDFGLRPISSWLVGQVTNYFNGSPIQNAWVYASNGNMSDGDQTNSTGWYNITLAPGDYQVSVGDLAGYRPNMSSVTVLDNRVNYHNVSLLPQTLPLTTLLSGWVNSSSSGLPIANASVNIYRNDVQYWNQTMTNSTGHYQINVPPLALDAYATANDFQVSFRSLNASGKTNYTLNFQLMGDSFWPNVSLAQAPTTNISMHRPTVIHATVEEPHLRWAMMTIGEYWNTTGPKTNYLLMSMWGFSFDPMERVSGLNYSLVGDNYTVDTLWDATLSGGRLWNSSAGNSQYLPASKTTMYGSQQWFVMRGYFENATIGPGKSGNALFDVSTGNFERFVFDQGSRPDGSKTDTSAVFFPSGTMLEFRLSNWPWPNFNNTILDGWHVSGLKFIANDTAPSGMYVTDFIVTDWGSHYTSNVTNLTVDNDPPIADAGPNQTVFTRNGMTFDASLSSDNVGIVNYTWTFAYNGSTMTLYGPTPSFTFNETGWYNVTLTVWDAAGNSASDIVEIHAQIAIPEPPLYLLAALMAMVFLFVARRKKWPDIR